MSATKEYLGIIIDPLRDKLLPEQGLKMLTAKGFYKKAGEESPQETFARAAVCWSFGDYEFAQRIYDYVSQHWFTFASPVLSNSVEIEWPEFSKEEFEDAGEWLEENVSPEGMPISCFLSYIPDTKEGLVEARKEQSWLSMLGGGLGNYLAMRSPDEKSTGAMAHLRGYDADSLAYRQTSSRRGSIASYMDITHPEILSFLNMRDPVGGSGTKCFNLHHGINIPDAFMYAVVQDQQYELIDPKHGSTGDYLRARDVWEKILNLRFNTGEPFLNFIDTVNRGIPDWITKATYYVNQSNLCSEITLMTSAKRTAVCCLSSANLEKYDEWKDSPLIEDLVRLLDNVIEYFVRLAPPELKRATHSSSQERALGLGTLGFHSYLQKHRIPFESGGFGSAAQINSQIYSHIKSEAVKASKQLALERGEPEDLIGSGMRNSHLLAIAPNASTSSLVNVSPSIEPWKANIFTATGRAGSFLLVNKYLEEELEVYNLNTERVRQQILRDEGSVQNVEGLPDEVKAVFKTAKEISPMWIVEHTAQRQKHICQSQSLNIFVSPDITLEEMSDIHFKAWADEVKTMYYCRADTEEKVSISGGSSKFKKERPLINFEDCLSCEG